MPKFGLTMQEGTIQQWFKAPGDLVRKGEPLFEVETEKVLYEVEATATGTLALRLYDTEATVPCATVIAVIALEGEDVSAIAARYRAQGAAARTPEVAREVRTSPSTVRAGNVPVTPAARRVAKDHGIDLTSVRGTGPGGRITREDVEAVVGGHAAEPQPSATGGVQLRGRRRVIAERMLESIRSTAQLTICTEADVTTMVARREQLARDFPVTYTDLLIEAVAAALRAHPRLNATASGDRVCVHDSIDIAVAVALDDGLIAPVIRSAHTMTIRQLAEESRRLAARARDGALEVDDVAGGTFTITNLGMYGVDAFTPILHLPQVAILGVGRIVEKPVVHEGCIVPRRMMTLSLTFDHRIVDGAPAAEFLQAIVSRLQAEPTPPAAC
jgi:pyruvate dehydrogenase E2 component (dihydrolipoamide acetyltransferase)